MLTSPALQNYWREQLLDAAQVNPYDPTNTSPDAATQWREAITAAADAHSNNARKIGTNFHEWAAAFHLMWPGGRPDPLADMKEQCLAYGDWFDDFVTSVLMQEQVVFGKGYAGQLDALIELKDGRIAIIDPKTQGMSGRNKFNHYLTWALQLGAYALAVEQTLNIKVHVLISPCVSSTQPGLFDPYEWPEPVSLYGRLFLNIAELWEYENNYFPSRGIFALDPYKQEQQPKGQYKR
jgi:hypothetical protein